MTDTAGNDVSTGEFWRGSMMANASRDPYWRASVQGEVLANPDHRAVIEDKCATCHMPMAHVTSIAAGSQGQILDEGFLSPEHDLHVLALDAVSCSLCHQIRAEGLDTDEVFGGGFVIDVVRLAGERDAFGPYPVDSQLAQLMQSSSGFIPLEGAQVGRSELCATCHTLYTPYLDAEGEIAGEFPEQTPYLEWQHSSFRDSISCQSCHMPAAKGGVVLSVTGGPMRQPFSQHIFVGGNAYMLAVLERFGPDLGATASSAHFAQKQAQVRDQIEARTAAVAIDGAQLNGSTLTAELRVTNRAGHKFPTGFPARRVWLHVTIADAGGQIVFESGALGANGAIDGNDNDADPLQYELHYEVVEAADQVQIYESIMGNTEGEVTTTLLRGAGYLKDNRLLPVGFDKGTAAADISVYGHAAGDADFQGTGDRVRYVVDVGEAPGPFVVTAELLYQSIGYRWVENLRRYDAAEPAAFLDYYEQVPNEPLVVSTARQEVAR